MEKEKFELLMDAMNERARLCHYYLDSVTSTEDLKKMTVEKLLELKAFCQKESNTMTQICMVDLYHVIGMGKLTTRQMPLFLKVFKDYCSFRSDLKILATHLNNISELPSLPTKSKFTLKALCDLTFESELRGESKEGTTYEDTDNITDYAEARKELKAIGTDEGNEDLNKLGISLMGKNLRIKESMLESFAMYCNTNCSFKTFRDKIMHNATYYGVKWCGITGSGIAVGTCMRDESVDHVQQFIDSLK